MDFPSEWGRLAPSERRRLRRLVRTGGPVGDPGQVALAAAYAGFQRSRPWWRLFWFWFVPGVVVALGTAARAHPVLVGMVLAMSGQALLVRRNTARAERAGT